MVEVEDEKGNKGIGFGYTIGSGGSAIFQLLEDELLDSVVGQDSRRIGYIHHLLTSQIHALTPGCSSSTAIAAIDVALWDLAGHRANAPLSILLGGCHRKVLAYNTHVGWLSRPLPEMLEMCRRAILDDGFRALKIKVGKPDPEEDVNRIARVRETVGNDVQLMVDANQSWTASEAVRRAKKLEKYNLGWLEEPVPATDLEGFRTLGEHTRIPRAGGESLYSVADFLPRPEPKRARHPPARYRARRRDHPGVESLRDGRSGQS
jgi:L-alanine-DL-glutamate epimerase-like enolase superfamily enzyme